MLVDVLGTQAGVLVDVFGTQAVVLVDVFETQAGVLVDVLETQADVLVDVLEMQTGVLANMFWKSTFRSMCSCNTGCCAGFHTIHLTSVATFHFHFGVARNTVRSCVTVSLGLNVAAQKLLVVLHGKQNFSL